MSIETFVLGLLGGLLLAVAIVIRSDRELPPTTEEEDWRNNQW
jgi:hypothetical protein